jgi:hypothetical protein
MTTDKGEVDIYEIGDITECVILDGTEKESPEKPAPIKDEVREFIEDIFKGVMTPVGPLMDSFSLKDKKKLVEFYARVWDLNLPPKGGALFPIIKAMIDDPGDEVMKYVEMYKTFCRESKLC